MRGPLITQLNAALARLRAGATIRDASRAEAIPYSTLHRHARKAGVPIRKPGNPGGIEPTSKSHAACELVAAGVSIVVAARRIGISRQAVRQAMKHRRMTLPSAQFPAYRHANRCDYCHRFMPEGATMHSWCVQDAEADERRAARDLERDRRLAQALYGGAA